MRRSERVERERLPLHRDDEALPHPPVGEELGADRVLHPRGEALVEPQVVPPLHRDEVAKPLVRELVDDHLRDALQLARGRVGLVDEQVNLAVRDEAPVLHRARRKLRDRHHVGLGQRVRHVKGLVIQVERLRRAPESERAKLRLAWRHEDAYEDAVLGEGRDQVELAHHEREQVRRHPRRRHEAERPGAVAVVSRLRLGHV
mmetsp:Transcript_94997/g.284757  ORF Transcript_94997/g.284757 Transcript_94997/m.284757 type:complete len:202 (+) Transcript_94997:1958-2563(+)